MTTSKNMNLGIIGAGYVGLPLAASFAKDVSVKVYDINTERITRLKNDISNIDELAMYSLEGLNPIIFTSKISDLCDCNVFIIAVPTPVDKAKNPDLSALKSATRSVAGVMKEKDIIIFESTVYPGCTEEICIPILEEVSEMKVNVDFFCGFSPERINPGDRNRALSDIVKVVSGSNEVALNKIDGIYKMVVKAGTHRAPNIKVAEASKIIENTQRDVNIALINELTKLFDKLDININAVLNAALTKWNFLDFKPGLVGGHCIGVDPYYLTYKAKSVGFHPEIILSGRKTNDEFYQFIAQKFIKALVKKRINIIDAKILILGCTFKEDCGDIRNSKVFDLYDELVQYGCNVSIYDPIANVEQIKDFYNIDIIRNEPEEMYQGIIFAVSHAELINYCTINLRKIISQDAIVFDLKAKLDASIVDIEL
ncbi:nucleotide sugar dehydrogenase [Rhodobacteraceae bacterium]|nr:nucleotide sugar dehydrogenase [Paracoccaceae bacterium]